MPKLHGYDVLSSWSVQVGVNGIVIDQPGGWDLYVVTDLTRFAPGNPNVCTALIDVDTGRCVRPMPYLQYDVMRRHGIIPGALLEGEFSPARLAVAPHVEDCDYRNLRLFGPATRQQFHEVLVRDLSQSVSAGFDYNLPDGERVIPVNTVALRSIITIRVEPREIEILPDRYNAQKIKLNFRDSAGQQFRYAPITDLGFYDFASTHRDEGTLAALNDHLRSSEEILLRVGLSRAYEVGNRNGYWVQVNGIYSFPTRLDVVRGYR